MANGIQLAPLMTQIKVDIAGFNSQMQKAATAGVAKANEISKSLSNVAKVGDGLSKVGGNLTKFVTAPLAGVATVTAKLTSDFESSFAKVSTLLDSNKVDFNKYKQDLIKGSDQSGIAVKDFSEAVYQSISAGVDQTKAIGFTTQAMNLAKGGFAGAGESVDLLTTILNGYNLKAEDTNRISDVLINTQNMGKTTVKELASSMGTVIPIASASNYNINELAASYAELTSKGVATSEAGTYVRSMLTELTKSGTEADKTLRNVAGKGFAQLKAEGKPTTEILKIMSDYAQKNGKTLKDMFGTVEGGSAAMIIASGDGKQYNDLLESMTKSAGATADAVKKIDATPAERLKKSFNELKNKGIEVGEKLMPLAEKGIDLISKVADKISGMSDAQVENALKWGAIAMAAGPVLKILGGAIGVFTKIAPVVGGAVEALTGSAGFVGALGAVAEVATGPVGIAIAGVTTAVVGIGTALTQDVVPKVDLFKNGISDATKTAVGSYMELDDKATKSLNDLSYNHTIITGEIVNTMSTQFDAMGQVIVDKAKEHYQTYTTDLQDFFANNTGMTQGQEDSIIMAEQQFYAKKQGQDQEYQNQYKAILQKASDEHRALSDNERQQLLDIQGKMRNDAIDQLSQTEQEANVIKQRMKDYQERLTVEQASNMLQTVIKAKDDQVAAEEEKYDKIINDANRLREAGAITEDQYNQMVDSARRTRDSNIDLANQQVSGVRDAIANKTPEIMNRLDEQTGSIKKGWQGAIASIQNWWNSFVLGDKTATLKVYTNEANANSGGAIRNRAMSYFNGLSYVPTDGYMARLHKGERVLTADENKQYTAGESGGTTNINFNGNYSFKDSKDIEYFMNQAALKLKGVR